MFVLIVVLIVILIFVIVAVCDHEEDRKAQERSDFRRDFNLELHDSHNWCGHKFQFDDKAKKFVIDGRLYNFSDFLGFEILYENDVTTTVKTSTSSAIGRGLVGGALFGPIGAIAGAATAKKTVTSKPGPQVMVGANIYLKGNSIRIKELTQGSFMTIQTAQTAKLSMLINGSMQCTGIDFHQSNKMLHCLRMFQNARNKNAYPAGRQGRRAFSGLAQP